MYTRTLLLSISLGCTQRKDECYVDSDCPNDQECIITHDHEGDDHNHGGDCQDKNSDTAE